MTSLLMSMRMVDLCDTNEEWKTMIENTWKTQVVVVATHHDGWPPLCSAARDVLTARHDAHHDDDICYLTTFWYIS